MRALQGFSDNPLRFGSWFLKACLQRRLPWAWDEDETLLLHRWAREWEWYPALTHPRRPPEDQAAALAALLAMAHCDCFKYQGEMGVWSRLAPNVGIPEGNLSAGVDALMHRLHLYRPPSQPTKFRHLIPFLGLVGCPHQALPIIGHRLKVADHLPERFKVMLEAKWEDVPDPEADLRAWLRGQADCPRWLAEADAAAFQREAARAQRSGPRWRCVVTTDGHPHITILPGDGDAAPAWRGAGTKDALEAAVALRWGVPQKLGEDGWIEPTNGPRETLGWPRTPSFWRLANVFLDDGAVAYEMNGDARIERVFLPPRWSLDGIEVSEEWQWKQVHGRCPVFSPIGVPWNPPSLAQTDLESRENIQLDDHPELAVLFQLPTEIPGLRATPGNLGATLAPGEAWAASDALQLPPMGHLHLSWGSNGQARVCEVFILPGLQFITHWEREFRVWVMGMESLIGHEEAHWHEVRPLKEGDRWTAFLDFKGWGEQPLRIKLSGPQAVLGGALHGPLVASSRYPSHSPWDVTPDFFDQTFRDRSLIQLQLPEGASARICLEDGGWLESDRLHKDGHTIPPLCFQDPLRPLLAFLEPTARPIRLSLEFPAKVQDDFGLPPFENLVRVHPRDREFSIRVESGELLVTPTASPRDFDPSGWTIRLGSMTKPDGPDGVSSVGLQEAALAWRGNTLHAELPSLPEAEAPFWLQLVGGNPDLPPISLPLDGEGNPMSDTLEAFHACVRAMQLTPRQGPYDLPDPRDRLYAFAFGLASQVVDFWSAECFSGDEQEAILDHLEGDFLYSQPWTLAVALRHPTLVLDEMARHWEEPIALSRQLARLAQAGWTWWVVGYAGWQDLAGTSRGRLRKAIYRRYQDCMRYLRNPMVPATRLALAARVCEEGFIRFLNPQHRRELMTAMGFPFEFSMGNPDSRASAICSGQVAGLLGDWQQEWDRLGAKLLPGVAITDVATSARDYQQWLCQGHDEPLLRRGQWAAMGPQIFRHFAIPFVGVLG